jgi:hypothetical protein
MRMMLVLPPPQSPKHTHRHRLHLRVQGNSPNQVGVHLEAKEVICGFVVRP